MDILKILLANGIESEAANTIADVLKQEIPKDFVSKTQYTKRVNQIEELNTKLADLEAKGDTDQYKGKYETLVEEYNEYKINIEKQNNYNIKSGLVNVALEKEGFNSKMIKLLSKEIDFEQLEVEDGSIKGWEEVVKPLKDNYGDYITVTQIEGNPPATPPPIPPTNLLTREQINAMSQNEINANWDIVNKSLSKL